MSIVYRAKDRLLGRIVAVKVLHPQYAADADFRDRFQREAQSAASLSHPNVVQIYDVGAHDSTHFIVMEYVQGRNLKEILRESGRLPIPTAVYIAQQVCRALAAAHRKGIIHRDVKPHNILVTDENHVKVTDFGIARAASAVTVTQTGTILGSVHYVSPEQARGRPVTAASDIYSLGVLCYEMLTGRVPFQGESALTVAMKHIDEEPVPLRRWVPEIPPDLEAVVLRALRKNPRHRYADGDAMLAALRPFLPTEPEQLPLTEAPETRHAPKKGLFGESGRISEWWRKRRGTSKTGEQQIADPPPGERPAGEITRIRARTPHSGDLLPASVAASEGIEKTRVATLEALEATRVARRNESRAAEHAPSTVQGGAAAVVQSNERGDRRRIARVTILFFVCFFAAALYGTIRSDGFQSLVSSIVASIFPPEVEVPDIVGRSLDEARALLAERGLRLRVAREVNSEFPVNTVVRQRPEGESIVRQGRVIDVDVSIGVAMVEVPDLTGLSERSARIELSQYALEIGEISTEYRADMPPNLVIGQTPPPRSRVQVGSRVDIVLSTGTAPVPNVVVPDFTGRLLEDVLREIESLGLMIGVAYPEDDPSVPPGVVIAQDLPPGDEVEVGRRINLAYRPEVSNTGEEAPGGAPPAPAAPGAPTSDRVDALLTIVVPPGPPQLVEIVVIDNLSIRTVYRETHSGGARLRELVVGHGSEAMYQVWIGGQLVADGLIRDA